MMNQQQMGGLQQQPEVSAENMFQMPNQAPVQMNQQQTAMVNALRQRPMFQDMVNMGVNPLTNSAAFIDQSQGTG